MRVKKRARLSGELSYEPHYSKLLARVNCWLPRADESEFCSTRSSFVLRIYIGLPYVKQERKSPVPVSWNGGLCALCDNTPLVLSLLHPRAHPNCRDSEKRKAFSLMVTWDTRFGPSFSRFVCISVINLDHCDNSFVQII